MPGSKGNQGSRMKKSQPVSVGSSKQNASNVRNEQRQQRSEVEINDQISESVSQVPANRSPGVVSNAINGTERRNNTVENDNGSQRQSVNEVSLLDANDVVIQVDRIKLFKKLIQTVLPLDENTVNMKTWLMKYDLICESSGNNEATRMCGLPNVSGRNCVRMVVY
jgi:hypothetical protein